MKDVPEINGQIKQSMFILFLIFLTESEFYLAQIAFYVQYLLLRVKLILVKIISLGATVRFRNCLDQVEMIIHNLVLIWP